MLISPHACHPLPLECVYSILARIHIQSGETSPFTTLESWTGLHGYKPVSGLPTKLEVIAKKLSLKGGVGNFVNQHTHYRLYAHFLNDDRRKFLKDAMKLTGSPKSRLGVLASRVGAHERLKYCPYCIVEDLEHFGVAYWHMEHTIPGVFICSRHNYKLTEIVSKSAYEERQLFLPPGKVIFKRQDDECDITKKLFYIATQMKTLLESVPRAPVTVKVYKRLLKERNLITVKGHVRQKEVVTKVYKWLSPLKKVNLFSRMYSDLKIEHNWVSELVGGKQGFHHPLKHLVVWGAIETDAIDIFNTANALGEQLELDLRGHDYPAFTKNMLESVLDKVGTLRGAASYLDTTVTTVAAYADAYGLKYRRRPKCITDEIRNSVCDGYLKGKKSTELAALHSISIGSVNRIIRKFRIK